jgi:uncharacterized membrane protein
MYWNRWYATKSYVLSALWLAPLIAFVLSQLLFRGTNALGLEFGWIPGFQFSPEGAVSAMEIDITLNISFLVFTFGSLLVAIQVASGQLTPRIIATTLLRDNVIRCTVGLFCFGLLLAIGARNRLESIPHFIISITAILGLVSTIAFLVLIDYAARLLRPVSIVWRVGEQGLNVIKDVYRSPIDRPKSVAPVKQEMGPPERTVEHQGKSGIVLAVNLQALTAEAQRAEGIVEFVPRVGDFVAVGDPLFHLRGGATAIQDGKLRGQVAFGRERTIEQDSTFAFRVIVDIAIKALSKAINDPTTAVLAIDQLHRLLRMVGRRHLHDDKVYDRNRRLRVIFRTPDWEDFVELACSEIRFYGAENFQIARRMRWMCENLIETLPERRHAALRRELELLDYAVEKIHPRPEDVALSRVADSQGLGGASGVKA